MKQTAIDFLIEKLQLIEWIEDDGQPHEQFKIIEQAKEMEKQQIIDIVEKSRETGLTAEYLLLTYGSKITKDSEIISCDKLTIDNFLKSFD